VANQLGAELLAYLVLTQTYILIANDLINVQTWESMIKFGSYSDNSRNLASIIKTNLVIDIVSAIAAFSVAVLLVGAVVSLLNWDERMVGIISLYSISILSNITCLTIGIPRLFNKFKHISVFQVTISLVKLIFVILASLSSQDLIAYIYIYFISDILLNGLLISFSLYLLRKELKVKWWREKIKMDKDQFRFVWWMNLRTIVRVPVRHFDMIVISSVMSLQMVGIYKVYKEIAGVVNRIQDPVNQTIYPEFTKLLANRNTTKTASIAKKTMLLLTGLSVVLTALLLLTSSIIIETFFGSEYILEINALYALSIVYLFSFITVPINSLFVASGFAKSAFYILLLTNSLYLASAYFFGIEYGIYGIVIAYAVQLVFNRGFKIYLLNKYFHDWGTTIR
jgi:O-antigen/teichoic acid export membrane protein